MLQNLTIKRNLGSFILYWFWVNVLLFIGLVVIKVRLPDYLILGFGVLVNVILLLSLISKFRLMRLTLNKDEKHVIIEMDKWFIKRKTVKVPLTEITITFKQEHRARGIKARVFKIFRQDQLLIEAVPGLSGFKEDDLVKFLNAANL
jgi:hypothetical protein